MPIDEEIERKFKVDKSKLPLLELGKEIRQGYINEDPSKLVRVRIEGQYAYLTVKGEKVNGRGPEIEFEIPMNKAEKLLHTMCDGYIHKTRFIYFFERKKWEIDIFNGRNSGLVLAECELDYEDEEIILPDWVTEEVTEDNDYKNNNLLKNGLRS